MDFLKTAADSVTRAVNFVVDKNRRAAMMNRLKIVIRNEKDTQARAYMELGKYYFENLRDSENEKTEKYCTMVENSGRRLKRAYSKLDELAVPAEIAYGAGCEDDGCCCGPDCECDTMDDVEPDEEAVEADDMNNLKESAGPNAEAADDDEEFLRPFTVVPNDTQETQEQQASAQDQNPETK